MNPYEYVRIYTKETDRLLSLCCGIGFELQYSNTKDITGVDISKPYIDELNKRMPWVKTFNEPTVDFLKRTERGVFDVISFIDGLEHMDKESGLESLKLCLKINPRVIILFTQEGYLRNEPHNAWGIEGADEYQTHKAAWYIPELEELGFRLVNSYMDTSQHGEPYKAIMLLWERGD